MRTSALCELFTKASSLVGGDKLWKPTNIDLRTWQRWRHCDSRPAGHSAKIVALELWELLESEEGRKFKSKFFDQLVPICLDKPREPWTKETFASAIFELAEKEMHADEESSKREAFQADLDLLVWRSGFHNYASVRQPNIRPLRKGDGVRVEVRTNNTSKAYFYLIWLTKGERGFQHFPFHPWNGAWDKYIPEKDIPLSSLFLPDDPLLASPVIAVTGLETIVLMLRRSPMPEDLRLKMPERFEALLKDVKSKVSSFDPELIEDSVHTVPSANQTIAPETRSVDFTRFIPVRNLSLELGLRLRKIFGDHFDFIRTLTVANVGQRIRT